MPVPTTTASRPPSSLDLGSIGVPARPEDVSERAEVPVAPGYPFHLRWKGSVQDRAQGWAVEELDGKPVILPVLSRRLWQAGVGGVRIHRTGMRPDEHYREVMRADEDRGTIYLDPLTEIPPSCLPSGRRGGYLQSAPCRSPRDGSEGRCYFEPFDQVIPSDDPQVPGRIICTEPELRQRFRRHLVESGQLPAPTEETRKAFVARFTAELRRYQSLPLPDAELKRQGIEDRKARIQAATKAILPTRKPAKEE